MKGVVAVDQVVVVIGRLGWFELQLMIIMSSLRAAAAAAWRRAGCWPWFRQIVDLVKAGMGDDWMFGLEGLFKSTRSDQGGDGRMEDYGVSNSGERVVGVKKAGKGLCGSQDGGNDW